MTEIAQSGMSAPDDAVFRNFIEYKWDEDERFQQGLKSILAKPYDDPNKRQDDIEKAKCFYYSKFVRPIDHAQYVNWRRSQSIPPSSSDAGKENSAPTQVTVAEDPAAQQTDSVAPSQAANQPQYPRSFQELCEMVARGEEIPGIKQIPNKINEAPPSESVLRPRKKPWEIGTETETEINKDQ